MLVVDDNVDLVDMLAMVVEAQGHQVRKAYDGRSAISAALDYHPQVILLDVGMPDNGPPLSARVSVFSTAALVGFHQVCGNHELLTGRRPRPSLRVGSGRRAHA